MLKEVIEVRQNPGEDQRKMFQDEEFDLFIWYKDQETISGFQLCYDKGQMEKALSWHEGGGFSHDQVQSGEEVYQVKRASSLKSIEGKKIPGVINQLKKAAGVLKVKDAEFIFMKLKEYQKEI